MAHPFSSLIFVFNTRIQNFQVCEKHPRPEHFHLRLTTNKLIIGLRHMTHETRAEITFKTEPKLTLTQSHYVN